MSTKAKGAAEPIGHRLSVGMTETEYAALAAKAKHAGLSLARYLVEAGGQIDKLRPVVTPEVKEFKAQRAVASMDIRGRRGTFRTRRFWHFAKAPAVLSSGDVLFGVNLCHRGGDEWVDRAHVGDVVVWEAAAIKKDGGMGEVAGYRVGIVETRRVKICGWHRTSGEAAIAVDALLIANGRTP